MSTENEPASPNQPSNDQTPQQPIVVQPIVTLPIVNMGDLIQLNEGLDRTTTIITKVIIKTDE